MCALKRATYHRYRKELFLNRSASEKETIFSVAKEAKGKRLKIAEIKEKLVQNNVNSAKETAQLIYNWCCRSIDRDFLLLVRKGHTTVGLGKNLGMSHQAASQKLAALKGKSRRLASRIEHYRPKTRSPRFEEFIREYQSELVAGDMEGYLEHPVGRIVALFICGNHYAAIGRKLGIDLKSAQATIFTACKHLPGKTGELVNERKKAHDKLIADHGSIEGARRFEETYFYPIMELTELHNSVKKKSSEFVGKHPVEIMAEVQRLESLMTGLPDYEKNVLITQRNALKRLAESKMGNKKK